MSWIACEKVRDEMKNYEFELIKESSHQITESNCKVFFNIFGIGTGKIEFINNVTEPKSIENFKNFIYENCKLKYK